MSIGGTEVDWSYRECKYKVGVVFTNEYVPSQRGTWLLTRQTLVEWILYFHCHNRNLFLVWDIILGTRYPSQIPISTTVLVSIQSQQHNLNYFFGWFDLILWYWWRYPPLHTNTRLAQLTAYRYIQHSSLPYAVLTLFQYHWNIRRYSNLDVSNQNFQEIMEFIILARAEFMP